MTAKGNTAKVPAASKKAKAAQAAVADVAPPAAAPKQPQTLYDISKEYTALEEMLSTLDGDITPESQKQIDEFLGGLDEDRDRKIDAYCGLIRDLEARAEARKKEEDRFAQLRRWDENKAKRLKAVLLNFLQLHNVEKIETVRFRVRRAANAARPVVLGERFVEFPEQLPERFRLTTFKANLKEISQALKDGESLDFASFGDKAENLRIE